MDRVAAQQAKSQKLTIEQEGKDWQHLLASTRVEHKIHTGFLKGM